jgi:hypothetical protein
VRGWVFHLIPASPWLHPGVGHSSCTGISSMKMSSRWFSSNSYLTQFLIMAAFTVFCCTSGSDTMFTWLGGCDWDIGRSLWVLG